MKQFDESFYELYNRYQVPTPASQRGEAGACHREVLRKAGLVCPRARPKRSVLLAAAAVAAAALTAAAGFYSASDAFRGALEVEDYGTATASSAKPVLDRAGIVVDDMVQSAGVQVSLRAVAGDDQTLKLLVDVEDASGNPLALQQADGSYSTEEVRFGQVRLEMPDNGISGYSWGSTVIGGDPAGGKASILIHYNVQGKLTRGDRYTLQLEDLMQIAELEGVPVEMPSDALYEILSQFDPCTEADFVRSGYSADPDGTVTYDYSLAADSGKSLPLSQQFPGVRITNASLWNGELHLRGTAESLEELERLTYSAALVYQNGAVHSAAGSGYSGEEGETITWDIRFQGIASQEDLKGAAWFYNCGEDLYPLKQGEWEFTFTLDYQDTSRVVEAAQPVFWEGYHLTAARLELSPFALRLEMEGDPKVVEDLYPATIWGEYRPPSSWERADRSLYLIMEDGSEVEVSNPGGRIDLEGRAQGSFELYYTLERVLDPAQMVSVRIGEQTIPLS